MPTKELTVVESDHVVWLESLGIDAPTIMYARSHLTWFDTVKNCNDLLGYFCENTMTQPQRITALYAALRIVDGEGARIVESARHNADKFLEYIVDAVKRGDNDDAAAKIGRHNLRQMAYEYTSDNIAWDRADCVTQAVILASHGDVNGALYWIGRFCDQVPNGKLLLYDVEHELRKQLILIFNEED